MANGQSCAVGKNVHYFQIRTGSVLLVRLHVQQMVSQLNYEVSKSVFVTVKRFPREEAQGVRVWGWKRASRKKPDLKHRLYHDSCYGSTGLESDHTF